MKIGLFIPCYVDALYPEVGVSTFKLLRSLGLTVEYPESQTCCGQPMGNAGFERLAEPLAEKFDTIFAGYDYVVAPSVSCAAYVRNFHPDILGRKGHQCQAAGKTMDLVEFLHDVVRVESLPSRFPHRVSVHNSCHGVRELGLSSPSERNVPRFSKIIDLLRLVDGIEVVEPERPDECCGFGGMFSVEETAVSARMGLDKVKRHMATGAEYVTGPDSACLMHLQGVASKHQLPIKFIHLAQILASGL
ncbi:MAG: (Fe-S)-binding protein [Bacteroidaceae bacterium]|nr:(Fe-S)-binding protein [Bacteroidaceae bacterium]